MNQVEFILTSHRNHLRDEVRRLVPPSNRSRHNIPIQRFSKYNKTIQYHSAQLKQQHLDVLQLLHKSRVYHTQLNLHLLPRIRRNVVESKSNDDIVELTDVGQNLFKSLGNVLVRIINKSVSNNIVQHLQMILLKILQLSEMSPKFFILLLNHPEKQVVLEYTQKVRYLVTHHTQPRQKTNLLLHPMPHTTTSLKLTLETVQQQPSIAH